jgi:hypothetical protein
LFDVVILKEAGSTSSREAWVKSALIGRERLSLPFLHGSINARIYDYDNISTHSDISLKVIELKFDPEGKLRWPRSESLNEPRAYNNSKSVKSYPILTTENYREKVYYCDHRECPHSRIPFHGKDIFGNHVKDFHKEDISGLRGKIQ